MFGKVSKRTRERLEATGRRAGATVLAVGDRGMAITSGSDQLVANTEVSLKLTLRVEPDGEPGFEVEVKLRFPQLSLPSVGQRLAVIFDPDDHETLMLDDSPIATVDAALQASGRPAGQIDLVKDLMASAMSGASPADTQAIARQWAEQNGAVVITPNAMGAAGFGGPSGGGAQPDPVELLSQLASLKDRGMLTDAEFAEQKARILGE
jgi:hypothetical protein